jgi:DNA helicase TIP49 (TBP-interacting protein)
MLSKEEIFEQILKLGVKKGDLIFIAADLRRVGYFNKTRAETEEDICI